jgi:hypothetical protein
MHANVRGVAEVLSFVYQVTQKSGADRYLTQPGSLRRISSLIRACSIDDNDLVPRIVNDFKRNLEHELHERFDTLFGTINAASIGLYLDATQSLACLVNEPDLFPIVDRILNRLILEQLEIDGLDSETASFDVDANGAVTMRSDCTFAADMHVKKLDAAKTALRRILEAERKANTPRPPLELYTAIYQARDVSTNLMSHAAPLLPAICAVLSSPAASVHDERTFKIASRNSTKLRSRLKPESLARLTLIASFFSAHSSTDLSKTFDAVVDTVVDLMCDDDPLPEKTHPPIVDDDDDDM